VQVPHIMVVVTNLSFCKPSIQKLVTSVAHDAIANLAEETTRTDAYPESAPQAKMAVDALKAELSPDLIDNDLLSEALHKSIARGEAREKKYSQTVSVTRCLHFSFQSNRLCRYRLLQRLH
jgi:proteasome activator subunit 4